MRIPDAFRWGLGLRASSWELDRQDEGAFSELCDCLGGVLVLIPHALLALLHVQVRSVSLREGEWEAGIHKHIVVLIGCDNICRILRKHGATV